MCHIVSRIIEIRLHVVDLFHRSGKNTDIFCEITTYNVWNMIFMRNSIFLDKNEKKTRIKLNQMELYFLPE